MNILLVDDDRKVLETLSSTLAGHGHRLRTASDGQEALRLMGEETPDLVISDIEMPGMDGIAFMREAQARYPKTPVVLMTASRDLDRAIAAFRGGAFDFLKKPIDLREVLACIEKVREGRHQQRRDTPDIGCMGDCILSSR
jgi:two-component system nitrogen regulation response regulator GlnG